MADPLREACKISAQTLGFSVSEQACEAHHTQLVELVHRQQCLDPKKFTVPDLVKCFTGPGRRWFIAIFRQPQAPCVRSDPISVLETRLQKSGDPQVIREFVGMAMSAPPHEEAVQLAWHGQAQRAVSALINAGKHVNIEMLADIAINAPLFTSAQHIVTRVRAIQDRLRSGPSIEAHPYRAYVFREILKHKTGRASLEAAMTARTASNRAKGLVRDASLVEAQEMLKAPNTPARK